MDRPAPPAAGPGRPVQWIQLGGETIAELQPAPARGLPGTPVDPARDAPRVVGPGRLERRYRERIGELERTVETAALVERGSARLLDRVEEDLDRERQALSSARQQANRLLVGLGALQRENESLRARVLELESGREALTGARPARIGGRGEEPGDAPGGTRPRSGRGRTARSGRRQGTPAHEARAGFWARLRGSFRADR